MQTKQCSKCEDTKPLTEFWKEKNGAFGVHSMCKACKGELRRKWGERRREHFNAYMRKYNREHPKSVEQKKRIAARVEKCRYGLTPEMREEILKRQKYKCGLCRKPRRLVVDHDHRNKRVRGLLCFTCNRSLHLLDKRGMLERAIEYLRS